MSLSFSETLLLMSCLLECTAFLSAADIVDPPRCFHGLTILHSGSLYVCKKPLEHHAAVLSHESYGFHHPSNIHVGYRKVRTWESCLEAVDMSKKHCS